MGMLHFPMDDTPLILLGYFNLLLDKLQTSCLLPLLYSFSPTLINCSPTHIGGNSLDLVFSHPSSATDITATPLHISDPYLPSFTISLLISSKTFHPCFTPINLTLIHCFLHPLIFQTLTTTPLYH